MKRSLPALFLGLCAVAILAAQDPPDTPVQAPNKAVVEADAEA